MTLTEFLIARLDEDEAVARTAAIGSESWHLGEFDETVLWWPPSSPEKIAWNREHVGAEAAAEHARWGGQTIEVVGDKIAPHIARHDPARVLAECEAKRRIVQRCSERIAEEEADHSGIQSPDYYGGQAQRAEDALAILAYLALPYADHPDYDEAWKP